MSHLGPIPELDRKGLREFGLTTGVMIPLLFGLFFPWLLEHAIPRWPWVLGAVLAVWGLVAPMSLRPVYRGWMHVARLLGRITTPLLLGIVFFLVITPTALIMKLIRRDAMARRFDGQASYRVDREARDSDHFRQPF